MAQVELKDYSFEVYWKNDLTAKVTVTGSEANITRYVIHPHKQLFCSDKMTRYQINKILEMRCFDKGRPDAMEKLKAMGLTEYVPYDIVRITHGVSYNDFIWIRFPNENIKAEDVLVREF
jgi:hypothetical protein